MRSASRRLEDSRRKEKSARSVSEHGEDEGPFQPEAAHWRLAFDALPDGLSIHTASGRILQANSKLADIYGARPEEMVGRDCASVFHGDGPCPHDQVLASRQSARAEVSLPPADGAQSNARRFVVRLDPMIDERGEVQGYVRTMREVIDRQRAQEQLIKAERFATLGQMISGIAHDVGTPLNIISGYSEYLLMRTKPDAPGHKELTTILQQTRRIADFIKQMLDLARPPQGRRDAIPLRDFLGESLDLIGHHLRKSGIRASVAVEAIPPLIYGDAPRLRQAFFNILLNASQALEAGSKLEIVLGEAPGAPDHIMVAITATDERGQPHNFSETFSGFLQPSHAEEVIGMGLSLAKEVLDQFGIKVDAVAMEGRGVPLVLYIQKPVEGR